MFQWILKKINKNNKGFTLVELVVVIAILGILAGIAVPKLGASRRRAAIIAHNANVRTLMSAATMYIADYGVPSEKLTWTEDDEDKSWESYLQEWPEVPNGLSDVKTDDPIEGSYKVTIDTNGDIEVTPGEYKESDGDD
ncbi:type II secretion system protein [Schnuerera sp.]|uniref:type II secretion system protein n=1 Tax=Schnuerera sp. TaxID=2794844 RepID=UPI002BD02057|nr:type II secretion system protein [Schnuerera sp.]HSH37056.1 type II secretion system protein [Schnuerera sp.]